MGRASRSSSDTLPPRPGRCLAGGLNETPAAGLVMAGNTAAAMMAHGCGLIKRYPLQCGDVKLAVVVLLLLIQCPHSPVCDMDASRCYINKKILSYSRIRMFRNETISLFLTISKHHYFTLFAISYCCNNPDITNEQHSQSRLLYPILRLNKKLTRS